MMTSRVYIIFIAAVMVALFSIKTKPVFCAQDGIEQSSVSTISAEVLAIDKVDRTLTLMGTNGNIVTVEVGGNIVTVEVGPEARNFDQIEIGDQLNVAFYESVALYLGKPGTLPSTNSESVLKRSPKGDKPAGIIMETVDVSAIVTAIDRSKRTVTLQGADGKIKTVTVDKSVKGYDTLKIGDSIHARYTEAMAISVEKP
jgi:hypothetical protein